jgi:hypothetical protein
MGFLGIATLLAALVAAAVTNDSSDVPLKEGAEDVKSALDDVSEYLAKDKEQNKGGQLKRRIAQAWGDQKRFCRGIRQARQPHMSCRRRGDYLAHAPALRWPPDSSRGVGMREKTILGCQIERRHYSNSHPAPNATTG